MNICRASCSMPYLCKMVKIDEIPYLDGGISDAVPIRHSIKKGFEKNIVVLTREKNYIKKDSQILKVLDNRITRYNETMKLLSKLEKEEKVLIIRPEKVLIGRMDNNLYKMNAFYEQGYRITSEKMQQILKFITA